MKLKLCPNILKTKCKKIIRSEEHFCWVLLYASRLLDYNLIAECLDVFKTLDQEKIVRSKHFAILSSSPELQLLQKTSGLYDFFVLETSGTKDRKESQTFRTEKAFAELSSKTDSGPTSKLVKVKTDSSCRDTLFVNSKSATVQRNNSANAEIKRKLSKQFSKCQGQSRDDTRSKFLQEPTFYTCLNNIACFASCSFFKEIDSGKMA